LHSVSRLFSELANKEHRAAAARARELLADYERAEDLINIGAYQKGSNPKIDEAISYRDALMAYLQQGRDEGVDPLNAVDGIMSAVRLEHGK
jgi:flagellum-specific ATP synthase